MALLGLSCLIMPYQGSFEKNIFLIFIYIFPVFFHFLFFLFYHLFLTVYTMASSFVFSCDSSVYEFMCLSLYLFLVPFIGFFSFYFFLLSYFNMLVPVLSYYFSLLWTLPNASGCSLLSTIKATFPQSRRPFQWFLYCAPCTHWGANVVYRGDT